MTPLDVASGGFDMVCNGRRVVIFDILASGKLITIVKSKKHQRNIVHPRTEANF